MVGAVSWCWVARVAALSWLAGELAPHSSMMTTCAAPRSISTARLAMAQQVAVPEA